MSKSASPPHEPPPVPRVYSPLAGFLSFLVPGLGQIYQGRIGKGMLFLVCLLGLYFCGMSLGSWRNVYIPDAGKLPRVSVKNIELEGTSKALYYRLQYLGQLWIGVAALPAVWQYLTYDSKNESGGVLGNFERAPSEAVNNDLERNNGKKMDLGWVYTVIAGVLNILVIYDAFAGPVFNVADDPEGSAPEASPA